MNETSVKHILILGKHQYMVENLQSLLTSAGYIVAGFSEVEKAMDEYKAMALDMIVFTGAVNPNDFSQLIQWKDERFPAALTFEHHGGPATLVKEIDLLFDKSAQ
jgi:DNA-binding NtrC family response regulator